MGFCALTGKNYGRVDFSYLTKKDYFCINCKFQKEMKERNCLEVRRAGKNYYKCKLWEGEE